MRRKKKTSRVSSERWSCGGCWHRGARCWCCRRRVAPIPVVVVLSSSLPVIGHPYPSSVAPARRLSPCPSFVLPAHRSSSLPIVRYPCRRRAVVQCSSTHAPPHEQWLAKLEVGACRCRLWASWFHQPPCEQGPAAVGDGVATSQVA